MSVLLSTGGPRVSSPIERNESMGSACQVVLHVIRCVQRAAGIQRERLRGHDLGSQRHVGRHDEVTCGQPGEDARIGDVETRFDLPDFDERRTLARGARGSRRARSAHARVPQRGTGFP